MFIYHKIVNKKEKKTFIILSISLSLWVVVKHERYETGSQSSDNLISTEC